MDSQVVHIPALDSRISLAYRNNMFVADKVFPIVPTDKTRGFYAKYSKQALRSVVDDLDTGGYPRRYSLSQEPYGYYHAKGHGVEVALSDDTRDEADNKAEVDFVHRDFVQGLIALGRELEVVNLMNSTFIPNATTLSGSSKWSSDNSNPILAIMTKEETIIQNVPGATPANLKLLLPRPVFRAVRNNATVRDYVKSFYKWNGDKPMTAPELAAALEISEIIVVDNLELTSAEGQPDTLSFTWPSAVDASMALLFFSTGAPAPLTPNFGYIFRPRTGYFPLRQVRDEHGRFVLMISEEKRDTIMVEPNAAFLWNNPI